MHPIKLPEIVANGLGDRIIALDDHEGILAAPAA